MNSYLGAHGSNCADLTMDMVHGVEKPFLVSWLSLPYKSKAWDGDLHGSIRPVHVTRIALDKVEDLLVIYSHCIVLLFARFFHKLVSHGISCVVLLI